MNSRDGTIGCVVPSRQGVFSLSATCAGAWVCTRSLVGAWRVQKNLARTPSSLLNQKFSAQCEGGLTAKATELAVLDMLTAPGDRLRRPPFMNRTMPRSGRVISCRG